MAKFELKLPKMGESVAEATITSWLKDVGDTIEADEAVLEIATDKVDSEVPSEVDGVLVEKLFNVDDVVQVVQVIAVIKIEGGDTVEVKATEAKPEIKEDTVAPKQVAEVEQTVVAAKESVASVASTEDRFYSPLVKNIAKKEGISQVELDTIQGTGKDTRVTKNDIKSYLESRSASPVAISTSNTVVAKAAEATQTQGKPKQATPEPKSIITDGGDEIIEMSRMGKLISKYMVDSVQTSAHVQSFIEADVTNIWNWRKKVKASFTKREVRT